MLSEGYTGADLLEKLLIAEGLIAIISLDHVIDRALLVAHVVGAMLGEKYMSEILSEVDVVKRKVIDVEALIDEYTSPVSGSEYFEERMLKLTKIELSYVLLATGPVSLSFALRGCSKSFIYEMKKGLQGDSLERICKLFQEFGVQEKEVISSYQCAMLNHIVQLEIAGMISGYNDTE